MTLKELLSVNTLAMQYFQKQLEKNKFAKKYLYDRIPKSVAGKYKIGYAPKSGLIDWLNKHDVSEKAAIESGIIGKDLTHGDYYETFRRRITIPVIHAGWVVGFGGRDITGNSIAKYLNSRKSALYDKSAVLYGLWQAAEKIADREYAIVVEGYFDVLGLDAVGIQNVVAGCGTAFTEKHANALRFFTDTVYILMDGDTAGKKAAGKVRKILKKKGLTVNTTILPDDLDPDDYVKKYGKDKLLKLIGV